MPYPYSKGGVTSIAWGDITGTLADQTDLQAALDLKEDIVVPGWTDYVAEANWVASGTYTYSFSVDQWTRTYNDDPGAQIANLDASGTWTDAFRPTQMRLTLDSGPASEFTGSPTNNTENWVQLLDAFSNVICEGPIDFTSYNEEKVFTFSTLTFAGPDTLDDIDRLAIWSALKNTGPIVKAIEFLG